MKRLDTEYDEEYLEVSGGQWRFIVHRKAMSNNAIEDRLLTAEEAGKYLGLAEGTVRNKANRGEIPFERLGPTPQHSLRFRKSELDRWIASESAKSAPDSAA